MRYYPLGVDQLEDRCVPATVSELRAQFYTNLQANLYAASQDAQNPAIAQYLDWTADSLNYVIDVYEHTPETLPTPAELKQVRDTLRDFWANPNDPPPPIDYPDDGGDDDDDDPPPT